MRTTIDIPDALYRRLRARAAREGRTTQALILDGVKRVLSTGDAAQRRRVELPLVASKHPGTLNLDNARIYDVISFP